MSNFFKKLRDFSSMRRRTKSGRRRSARCAFWCVAGFYKV